METVITVGLECKKTKKDMILELHKQGLKRKEIAKLIGTYYNYVSDVIKGLK